MATSICSACGTRNPEAALTCRRCGGVLTSDSEGGLDSSMVLGGCWRLGKALIGSPHIFQGRHIHTNENVLIKSLNRSAAMDRSIRSNFLKEASILREIDHPNLIKVVDVIDSDDHPAIVMAHPAGETLRAFIDRREFFPAPIAVGFILQLLSALEYLHNRRIIHRNLSTETIHIAKDRISGLPHLTITDFGVARSAHYATEHEGKSGTLVGMQVADSLSHLAPSPYMAPELLKDDSDRRADIYSLGVILFELVAGRKPIGQGVKDPDRLLEAIQTEVPTLLRLLRPGASKELEDVMMRMMAKNPDERFSSVSETRTAIFTTSDATMVKIGNGSFLRGAAEDDPDARPEEKPQDTVTLNAYFVDRTPVTVAQFRDYLRATGKQMPENWDQFNPEESPDHPVVYVTWEEAAECAAWQGKRLPTEAEWEYAARGPDGRLYPWGNEPPNASKAQFNTKMLAGVGYHPTGASPFGCLDMSGNAFEWVRDWYKKIYFRNAPKANPLGPSSGKKRCLRGGSFVHDHKALRCSSRGRYEPHERRANHSFRCAWSFDLDE